MKNFSEEQIWKAFKDGSDEALSFIYYQYAPKLYNYGRQFCAEADQVKDAIQDLFCEMIQSRGRLGDTTSIKFYLYASLKRKLMRVQEKQHKQFAFVGLEGGFELNISDGNDLFNQLFSADTSQIIKEACAKLPEKQREAIALYFFEGLNYEEIAQIMAMTKVKSARALVYRALESLSEDLTIQQHVSQAITALWAICLTTN